jgi:hypothetical protein
MNLATQGLVSITQKGKVMMKIVAGCNGNNALDVAIKIRELGRMPKAEEAYRIARNCEFGSYRDLVVIDRRKITKDSDRRIPKLYRETFDDPRFNPRWKHGTANFTEIVDLDENRKLEIGKTYRLKPRQIAGLRYDVMYEEGNFIDVRILAGPDQRGLYEATTRGKDGKHLGKGGGWKGPSKIDVHPCQVEDIKIPR